MENALLENDIKGTIGIQKYQCTIEWRNGQMIMDEPVSSGGQDSGPDPYTTLLASLAGCTLATLRMYIDRKGWNIPEISVTLNLSQNQDNGLTTTIKRDIFFGEGIEHQVQERLLVIATKCPVSKILENKIIIQTTA
ncbi:OsmC family protein [Flectobacillus major]|uniref:OsmC family protein n=1 Tax=Flectobacillus major TaxID=103 RepID=UPI00041CDDB0|nr:OsmC family protein [Flectobacillus major]